MSEVAATATETTSTTVAAPAAQAPAAPAPGSVPNVGEPGWLKARTDRAADKAAKDAKKETKDALKAAERAAKEAGKAVQAANAEVQAAKAFADTVLADLPDTDRDAIVKASGGSVAKQLEMLAAYRIGKGSAAKAAPVETPAPAIPATAPTTLAAPAPLAPPASSTPAGSAPAAPISVTGDADHAAVYRELKGMNPYLAAEYLLNHGTEIYPRLTYKK